MLHHVSVGSNDVARAGAFYDKVFEVLGLSCMSRDAESIDYGVGDFFFSIETPTDKQAATAGNGVHFAFAARSRRIVDRFYEVALKSGGRDAGAPGLRPEYDAHYYGAFVFDPDGNKIEAVTYSAD